MAGRTQQQGASRRRKRPHPPVYSGLGPSYEDKDNDFVCPVCFDMIEEAYMTKCGHSFCFKCIKQSLELRNRCPKCNFVVEKIDQIFPNFHLNELILKNKQKLADKKIRVDQQNGHMSSISEVQDLMVEKDNLDITSINHLLDMLTKKKKQLESDCCTAQNQILKEFLDQIRQKKQEQLDQLSGDLRLIESDLQRVEDRLSENKKNSPNIEMKPLMNGFDGAHSSGADCGGQEGFNGSKSISKQSLNTSIASRRRKVQQHFDDLEQCYFSVRQKEIFSEATGSSESFEEFTECLSKFTKFSSCRPLATLSYASDIYNGSSIVSSIEFDRDCDHFAIAGVTKKIKCDVQHQCITRQVGPVSVYCDKVGCHVLCLCVAHWSKYHCYKQVFEYSTVIKDAVDIHYPVTEMLCNSKISSVTWSSYHKNMLASSDYEGTVTLWDAFAGVTTKLFQEHEKRCWSVDFNRMDPKLLASGSDDSKVKLWSTNMDHSISCLEAKANVCCVKFNPESRFHLAFGSADHCVHYYDLRNTKQPLMVFQGHRKAVSYAKFVNKSEIVSASTDSQLKLWNVNKSHFIRTFKGHINEKNFVGLASDGDYIACGSENNSLYIYYKGLSKQLVTYKFDTVRSVLERDKKEDEANEFVSAVCWRPGSNVVVAANSQGTIKVLELV